MLPQISENVPIGQFTTLGVGGNARFYSSAVSAEQINAALDFAEARGIQTFILGGGSNLLVSDDGFDGLVLHVRLKGIEIADGPAGGVLVRAGAGEDWDGLVDFCVMRGFAGIECLSGIPGYVGGTPIQNVGAYGQEVSDVIWSVLLLDRLNGSVSSLSAEQCGFAYRTSIFNTSERNRYVVIAVDLVLQPDGRPTVTYRDLIDRLDSDADLSAVRREVLNVRRAKSMVIDPTDPNSKSAGSFFKNPIIDASRLDAIRSFAPLVPTFPAGDLFKVPAAWLIENAGFDKGFRLGRAGISANHTLAIINRGGASAAEIIVLKNRIVDQVREKFNIELVPEPVMVGFDQV